MTVHPQQRWLTIRLRPHALIAAHGIAFIGTRLVGLEPGGNVENFFTGPTLGAGGPIPALAGDLRMHTAQAAPDFWQLLSAAARHHCCALLAQSEGHTINDLGMGSIAEVCLGSAWGLGTPATERCILLHSCSLSVAAHP